MYPAAVNTPHDTGDAPNTGLTIEQLLEQTVFADPDPRVQRLRQLWEGHKAEAADLFARADRENYEHCLRYHEACGAAQPEVLARAEASALRQLLVEERERRLQGIWEDTLARVNEVLTENRLGE